MIFFFGGGIWWHFVVPRPPLLPTPPPLRSAGGEANFRGSAAPAGGVAAGARCGAGRPPRVSGVCASPIPRLSRWRRCPSPRHPFAKVGIPPRYPPQQVRGARLGYRGASPLGMPGFRPAVPAAGGWERLWGASRQGLAGNPGAHGRLPGGGVAFPASPSSPGAQTKQSRAAGGELLRAGCVGTVLGGSPVVGSRQGGTRLPAPKPISVTLRCLQPTHCMGTLGSARELGWAGG